MAERKSEEAGKGYSNMVMGNVHGLENVLTIYNKISVIFQLD